MIQHVVVRCCNLHNSMKRIYCNGAEPINMFEIVQSTDLLDEHPSGFLKPDDLLPIVVQMSDIHGIAPNTVRRVLIEQGHRNIAVLSFGRNSLRPGCLTLSHINTKSNR